MNKEEKYRMNIRETSQIRYEALKSSAKVLLFSDIRKENRKIIFRAIPTSPPCTLAPLEQVDGAATLPYI